MKIHCPECRTRFHRPVGICDACGYQFKTATEATPVKESKFSAALLYALSAVVGFAGAAIHFLMFHGE